MSVVVGMVFTTLEEDFIQNLLRLSAGRLVFIYVVVGLLVVFFSILTFNNHRVIAIKCIATTAFLFPVDGVTKLGETIH